MPLVVKLERVPLAVAQVEPLSVLTCHSVVVGLPLTAALKLATVPGSTFWAAGCESTAGAGIPAEMLAVVLTVVL